EHHVLTLGAERDGDRVGELVDAGLERAPRLLTEPEQLGCHGASFCERWNGARRSLAREPPRRGLWLLADDGEDVAGRQDQVLVALDLDLGAAVLGVDDLVADRDVEGDAGPVLEATGAHR